VLVMHLDVYSLL